LLDPDGRLGLRVEKQGIWSHQNCAQVGGCQNLGADGITTPLGVTACQGRGWTPTQDFAIWFVAVGPDDTTKHSNEYEVGKFFDSEGGYVTGDRSANPMEALIDCAEKWAEAKALKGEQHA